MVPITAITDYDRTHWPDLDLKHAEGLLLNLSDEPAAKLTLAEVPGGTRSGRSSVLIRIDSPDGRVILAQTTLRLLVDVVRAFELRELERARG